MFLHFACRRRGVALSVVVAVATAIALGTSANAWDEPAGVADGSTAADAVNPAETSPDEPGAARFEAVDSERVLSGPISPKIMRYAEKVIRRYDLNGDGVLTEDEYQAMRGDPHRADLDGDGRITVEEYARRVVEYALRRSLWLVTHSNDETLGIGGPDALPSAPGQSGSDGAPTTSADEADAAAADGASRRNRRFYVSGERLRSLPEWFLAADADGDGQLTLEEFTARPPADGPGAFSRYDLDGDGIITPTEYLTAEKRRQEKQADSSSSASDGGRSP